MLCAEFTLFCICPLIPTALTCCNVDDFFLLFLFSSQVITFSGPFESGMCLLRDSVGSRGRPVFSCGEGNGPFLLRVGFPAPEPAEERMLLEAIIKTDRHLINGNGTIHTNIRRRGPGLHGVWSDLFSSAPPPPCYSRHVAPSCLFYSGLSDPYSCVQLALLFHVERYCCRCLGSMAIILIPMTFLLFFVFSYLFIERQKKNDNADSYLVACFQYFYIKCAAVDYCYNRSSSNCTSFESWIVEEYRRRSIDCRCSLMDLPSLNETKLKSFTQFFCWFPPSPSSMFRAKHRNVIKKTINRSAEFHIWYVGVLLKWYFQQLPATVNEVSRTVYVILMCASQKVIQ